MLTHSLNVFVFKIQCIQHTHKHAHRLFCCCCCWGVVVLFFVVVFCCCCFLRGGGGGGGGHVLMGLCNVIWVLGLRDMF